jgi:hypothetical protein
MDSTVILIIYASTLNTFKLTKTSGYNISAHYLIFYEYKRIILITRLNASKVHMCAILLKMLKNHFGQI